MQDATNKFDVTVIGGGLAGMAASIHLSRAGLRVVCIEADVADTDPVGESLDWSAPALLAGLGLPMDYLLEQGVATYKLHVTLKLKDGSEQHYVPGEWLGKPPYNVDLRTLHVDRNQLNKLIREKFLASGATVIGDRVVKVESTGDVVNAVLTSKGERIATRWFLDCSGSSALFGRAFNLRKYEYGPPKVAIWDYFTVPGYVEGTTLHADASGRYMEWVWQIPIHPHTVSIGYVVPGETVKERRRQGLSVRQIYEARLKSFPALEALVNIAEKKSPSTTSFRCRVFTKSAGPNWILAGEAAAMVDPMTSNGVTAALRHAAEAATLITKYRDCSRIPRLAAAMYSQRILSLASSSVAQSKTCSTTRPLETVSAPSEPAMSTPFPRGALTSSIRDYAPEAPIKTTLFRILMGTLRYSLVAYHWWCSRSVASPPIPAT